MIILTKQQIESYQQWERVSTGNLPGKYSFGFDGVSVFSIHKNDILKIIADYNVKSVGNDVQINYGILQTNNSLRINDTNCESIQRLIKAVDGESSFSDICQNLASYFNSDYIQSVYQAFLGHFIGNVQSIQVLQNRINKEEIVRSPAQSPYMILRSYWSNCADVRENVGGLIDDSQDVKQLMKKVADLHVLSTMGKSLNSLYGGSGDVPTIPGGYRVHPMSTGMSEAKLNFADDYLQDISLDKITKDERLVFTESNTLIGMVTDNALKFRHPPPDDDLLVKIFEEIRLVLVKVSTALKNDNQKELIEHLSRIHKLFLHAHPFYNINNSIVMNLVNYCLTKSGQGIIPHLLLDFIALRVSFIDYHNVFKHTVANYALLSRADDKQEVMSRTASYFKKLEKIEQIGHS